MATNDEYGKDEYDKGRRVWQRMPSMAKTSMTTNDEYGKGRRVWQRMTKKDEYGKDEYDNE